MKYAVLKKQFRIIFERKRNKVMPMNKEYMALMDAVLSYRKRKNPPKATNILWATDKIVNWAGLVEIVSCLGKTKS